MFKRFRTEWQQQSRSADYGRGQGRFVGACGPNWGPQNFGGRGRREDFVACEMRDAAHPDWHSQFGGFRGGREHERQGFGARGERGFGGGRHSGRGFGGGGRERLFDGGDLKLVILKLIADKPSYGYELIKAMEDRLAGGYAPSPGVVYPTLTMLEEEGLATVATSDAGKKVYTATDAGRAELTANQRRLAEIFERLEHAGRGFRRGRSPEIMRAFMMLRGAVEARVSREGLTSDQIAKMAEAIEAAARAIDAL